jgi:Short-chain alcohol dehydrogenase of unknown specificity
MSKVWMITGASRGFGLEFAKAALAAGDKVVATARDRNSIPLDADSKNLLKVSLDVTVEDAVNFAVREASTHFGRIDVLINNAGYLLIGAVEEISLDEAKAQFNTNVFGLMSVTKAVLPVMRAQQSGHIINVSSMAGIKGYPGSSTYSATKFAVEGLTESLAAEMAPFNIKVTMIEPGYFRTELLSGDSMLTAKTELPAYADTIGVMRQQISGVDGQQAGDPVKLVKAVRTIIAAEKPPLRLALGSDAVEEAEKKLRKWQQEVDQWRELSTSTDFD